MFKNHFKLLQGSGVVLEFYVTAFKKNSFKSKKYAVTLYILLYNVIVK